jgi:hypothetical protein
LFDELGALMGRRWGQIEAVAMTLMDRGTLSREEVEATIEAATAAVKTKGRLSGEDIEAIIEDVRQAKLGEEGE